MSVTNSRLFMRLKFLLPSLSSSDIEGTNKWAVGTTEPYACPRLSHLTYVKPWEWFKDRTLIVTDMPLGRNRYWHNNSDDKICVTRDRVLILLDNSGDIYCQLYPDKLPLSLMFRHSVSRRPGVLSIRGVPHSIFHALVERNDKNTIFFLILRLRL